MLINLHVKNLALIEETEVDFTDHLNILQEKQVQVSRFSLGRFNLRLVRIRKRYDKTWL